MDTISIKGFRGFSTSQTLRFAKPNGGLGSGLTVLVGGNNAGKSTAIEALWAIRTGTPSFSQGRRNLAAGDAIEITLADGNRTTTVRSLRPGTSETETRGNANGTVDYRRLFVLPSRRVFSPFFGRGEVPRDDYMSSVPLQAVRANSIDLFYQRLFVAMKDRERFDQVMKKLIDPPPHWTIDQTEQGQYFLKVRKGDAVHSSEGLGEGLVSLLFLVDAFYDSHEGSFIAIDEPELSLHPALQRKLASLISEYAATRQVVLATHSPYFVNFEALQHGATIARVVTGDNGSKIHQLSPARASAVGGLLRDANNPHVLGLNAQEIFFVEDGVVLLEGQEDVIFMSRVESDLGTKLSGHMYGWGVGGADKMSIIAGVLNELGYQKVVGIVDGNRAAMLPSLRQAFPHYVFEALPADDIRTKLEIRQRPPVKGLLDDTNTAVRQEYRPETTALFNRINTYLASAE